MKKRIFVSRLVVDQNQQIGTNDPVFTIINADGTEYKSSNITILGPCEVKYDRDGGDGMRVWIETFDKVIVKDGISITSDGPSLAAI